MLVSVARRNRVVAVCRQKFQGSGTGSSQKIGAERTMFRVKERPCLSVPPSPPVKLPMTFSRPRAPPRYATVSHRHLDASGVTLYDQNEERKKERKRREREREKKKLEKKRRTKIVNRWNLVAPENL